MENLQSVANWASTKSYLPTVWKDYRHVEIEYELAGFNLKRPGIGIIA